MVKIILNKKEIIELLCIVSEKLSKVELVEKSFVKGKDERLYYQTRCSECGKYHLSGGMLKFKEATKNHKSYILFLRKLFNRLKLKRKLK